MSQIITRILRVKRDNTFSYNFINNEDIIFNERNRKTKSNECTFYETWLLPKFIPITHTHTHTQL